MKIDIVALKEDKFQTLKDKIDCSLMETNDALIKKINFIDVLADVSLIESDEINIQLKYLVNVEYLDARTLNQLNLEFEYEDNTMFTFNANKAEEFDIDYISENILQLDEMIFNLAMVSLPINYSEQANEAILDESVLDEVENRPFEKIFKDK